jgi:hypothetical protein
MRRCRCALGGVSEGCERTQKVLHPTHHQNMQLSHVWCELMSRLCPEHHTHPTLPRTEDMRCYSEGVWVVVRCGGGRAGVDRRCSAFKRPTINSLCFVHNCRLGTAKGLSLLADPWHDLSGFNQQLYTSTKLFGVASNCRFCCGCLTVGSIQW